MKLFRPTLLLITVSLTLIAAMCGISFLSLINSAKAVTAASAPALDRMVARGVITDTQRNSIRSFLDGTTNNLTATHDEWLAAGGDKTKEVLAVQNAVNREAPLIEALVKLPPEAQTIIDDVNAAFLIIAAFYGASLPPSIRPAPGAPMVSKPLSEKDMERAVKARIEALKQKLQ